LPEAVSQKYYNGFVFSNQLFRAPSSCNKGLTMVFCDSEIKNKTASGAGKYRKEYRT